MRSQVRILPPRLALVGATGLAAAGAAGDTNSTASRRQILDGVSGRGERVPFAGSDRASRLPPNWEQLRDDAHRRNPEHICHWCGKPGGTDLDHIDGDWTNNASENLDWIHSKRDVRAGRSKRNCHGEKTGREAAAARWKREPPMKHPGLL